MPHTVQGTKDISVDETDQKTPQKQANKKTPNSPETKSQSTTSALMELTLLCSSDPDFQCFKPDTNFEESAKT